MLADGGTILVAGRNGQVALELARALRAAGYRYLAFGRDKLDIADTDAVDHAVQSLKPALVINAAAYTAVDKAENNKDAARAINALGAEHLAAAAHRVGAPIIHLSTDYVFDGNQSTPYVESDRPNPLSVYGSTKLEGERLVANANPRHVILRTAWIFSPHGQNFVKTILALGAEHEEIRIVVDQRGAPTSATDLADAIVYLSNAVLEDEKGPEQYGTFHITNEGNTTWHGFACAIMDGARLRGARVARVEPIATTDFPMRARRPPNSTLNTTKISRTYGIELQSWRSALENCLDTLVGLQGLSEPMKVIGG